MSEIQHPKPYTNSLRHRVKALELAMENLPLAVGLLQLDGRPLYLNRCFRDFYHVDERWHKDITFAEMISSGALYDWKSDPRVFFERLVATLKRDGIFEAQHEVGDRILAIHDRLLEGDLILSTQRDVTDQVRAERRVSFLATHDVLTELPNRAVLTEALDSRIEEARVTQRKFSVLSVDVDRFKDINDVFGHAAGDAVLSALGKRFKDCLGPTDVVARLGGDEFCFLSGGKNQPESAGALARRLSEAAKLPIQFNGHPLTVGLSIGLAIYPDDGEDRASLLSSSDAALYRAKADGRGAIRTFEPSMDRRMHDQRVLQLDLQNATQNGELELLYQPQASVDRTVYGFEALVRWRHPTKGLLGPDFFIPIAEESGQIIEIGEWVLRTACREAATWPAHLRISVNLSPVQFRHGDLVQLVQSILLETGLEPTRLELEVTEGVLVHDFSRALHILRGLKALGVQIAMDDFGTGYSSLSYLQAFPFDTLKIDKSFTAKLSTDNHANEIVRAVIGLGRGLNIPIVAEGVETPEQLDFLTQERCQNIQGFLIGKAEPIEAYAEITGRGTPTKGGNPA
ncbi:MULTISPECIES: putative bifunctional diguanylate cyclase/phosphodiesterase [Alphaproteobacteria]|uniref:Diguanylate cyclase n=2 Tax=Alphaproteobacteria TaxID=28211 RepID=A0A512HFW8_9HYPH|nr:MULTISPECIES: EAL domain-containing protein [Alphaproteobacteria]GEO84280.1 hypothetical protein RNA01_12120 [Ciceribacter naphthalenivorans]GLR24816.1 hypothetical protein GCM10007920_46100 [Ciceribacter naphthalenivorans]GLT07672.1 hypothetical protein GCM10007926_46100 [Sphingomonas psychrolutea]